MRTVHGTYRRKAKIPKDMISEITENPDSEIVPQIFGSSPEKPSSGPSPEKQQKTDIPDIQQQPIIPKQESTPVKRKILTKFYRVLRKRRSHHRRKLRQGITTTSPALHLLNQSNTSWTLPSQLNRSSGSVRASLYKRLSVPLVSPPQSSKDLQS